MTNKKTHKISVNEQLIDKDPPTNKTHYSSGFDPHELTLEEMCEVINWGYSISYQFKNGIRKSDNYLSTDIVQVDIDGGRSITDVLDDPIVKKYGSIFYRTVSHTPDHHRFRIVFSLPRTVWTRTELTSIITSLSRRLGGDMNVVDGARMFYGASESNPTILGKSITLKFLTELIADGSVIPKSDSVAHIHGLTPSRSKLVLDTELLLTQKDGSFIKVGDVKSKTSVCCPFHYDLKPSSFISLNERGSKYLYCSTCRLTWWNSTSHPTYDFDDFEKTVIDLDKKSVTKENSHSDSGLVQFMNDGLATTITTDHVQVVNEKFLPFDEFKEGVTFIKSPKGTGKTTYLSRVLKKYVSTYSSFTDYELDSQDEDKPIYIRDRSVLLIGHRQSLIGDLCNRLGLNSYLNDAGYSKGHTEERKNRYGICLDSLWKVKDRDYSLIVIDEVEQVLTHFLSDTMGLKSEGIFKIFSKLIRNAPNIIVLDADLGWTSFNTITSILKEREIFHPLEGVRNLQIYINTWKTKHASIEIYPTQSHIISSIQKSLENGERIFISSNSKKKIKTIEDIVKKVGSTLGVEIPRIMVTSENSKSKNVQEFISNVKSEILKYQVVLSSPSLGTGIDITFDNESKEIDVVFGLFENQINSHFEIDQQLGRVRHPKRVCVWLSPTRFEFETDLGVINADLQQSTLTGYSEDSYKLDVGTVESELSPFLRLSSMVTSNQRKSKNNLKSNFIKYKESLDVEVNWISSNKDDVQEGNKLYKNSTQAVSEQFKSQLMESSTFNRYDFVRFKDRIDYLNLPVSEDMWIQYSRTVLELFYCSKMSEEVIENDKNGQLRKKIRSFESILNSSAIKAYSSMLNTTQGSKVSKIARVKSRADYRTSNVLLHGLLSLTPIFDGSRFDTSCVFSSMDLVEFIKSSVDMKSFVETQLGVVTRKDVDIKPIQHLSQLLRLVGLDLAKVSKKNIDGKRFYFYQLDVARYEEIIKIVAHREEVFQFESHDVYREISDRYKSGWSVLDKLYNFHYSEDQANWLCPGYKDNFDDEEVLVKRDLLSGVEEYNDSLPIKDNAINDEYFRQFLDGG